MSLNTKKAIDIYGGPFFTFKSVENGRIAINPQWIKDYLVYIDTPIGKVQVNKLVSKNIEGFIKEGASYIDKGDYAKAGGCFVPRHISSNPKKPISLHSLGIAIDVNIWLGKDGYGGRMNIEGNSYQPKALIDIAARHGLEWGGHWNSFKDGMHFQISESTKPIENGQKAHKCKAAEMPVLKYDGKTIASRGQAVRELQEKLTALGYKPLKIDALYGKDSKKMVEKFQSDRKLTVDGVVGKNTWHALGW